jgi:hypothetical protein
MKYPKLMLTIGILIGATLTISITAAVLYVMPKTSNTVHNKASQQSLQDESDWDHDLDGLRPFTDAPTASFMPSSIKTITPSLRTTDLPSQHPSFAPSAVPSTLPTSERPSQQPSSMPTRILFPEETNFTLKLYWEHGYNWQEEVMERPWCVECMKCTNITNNNILELCSDDDIVDPSCDWYSQLWVQPCDYVEGQPGNAIFQVVMTSKGDMIQSSGSNLCLARLPPRFVVLDFCDTESENQRWAPLSLSSRFPLMPYYHHIEDDRSNQIEEPQCLTQQHHPRESEILRMESCSIAHKWNTGYWVALPIQ